MCHEDEILFRFEEPKQEEASKDNNLIAVSTKQNMQRNKILTLVESIRPSSKIDSVAPTRAANSRME